MKILAITKELANACRVAGLAAAKRTTAPALNHILLEAKDGTLTVTGSNQVSFVRASCPAEVSTAGAVGVPAKLLQEHLSTLKSDITELEITSGKLWIKSGTSLARISFMNADEFLKFPDAPSDVTLVAPECDIWKGFSTVKCAIGYDVTRPTLQSVFVRLKDLNLSFTATNGHRVLHTFFAQQGDGMTTESMVPSDLVVFIVAALDSKSSREVKMAFSDRAIRIESDSVTIQGSLVEGKFPPWEMAMPEPSEVPIKLNRTEMIEAIRGVRPFTDERFFPIALEFTINSVTISNLGNKHNVQKTATVENGFDVRVVCNPNYLEQALNSMIGDMVDLHLKDSHGPAMLRSEGFIGIISLCHGN